MPFGTTAQRWIAPLERAIGRWYDHGRDNGATYAFLLLFVLAWTLYFILAHASIDLHPDLTESYAWGLHPSAGYYKHPPLVALAAAAWFALFPATDWSFHLHAMTNAALALFAADLIARRYLTGDKRLMVLVLLMLLPFFQFHGQRISTNQLLLSTWPLATYFFLRAFESRTLVWSAAAGAMAAAAMLAKYYSVYLIAALVLAALTHPARWTYLKSWSPWISAAVGLALMAPHLYWLRGAEFGPFEYAYLVHGSASLADLFGKAGGYVLGSAGYAALPCAVYAVAVRPDRQTLKDAFLPADPGRRMLVVLFAAMLLLPPLTAPLIGMQLTSLWSMSAWFLLPVVLLAPDRAELPRQRAVYAAMPVVAITAGALVAAPAVAWANHNRVTADHRAYYRLLSEALVRQWREVSSRPLTIAMTTIELAPSITFYHPDHPDSAPDFDLRAAPWITPERMRREGFAAACPSNDTNCRRGIERLTSGASGVRRSEIEVTRSYLGRPGTSARFFLILVPPQPAAERAR
jgi:4-amino-4-deoxy-L-arabinose transferase-like glycosyltransferase